MSKRQVCGLKLTLLIVSLFTFSFSVQRVESTILASEVVNTKILEPGDNLIHGFVYHKGYLWASTRTSPCRILKIDTETLDYERIILDAGLNDGEDLIAAEGYIWVILYTSPSRIVRVNPETMTWEVAISFQSHELSYGASLEYAFGYLWAGGSYRKIARIALNDLTYNIYAYSDGHTFNGLTSGGGYLWGVCLHYSWLSGWYATSIVRINPGNPADYVSLYMNTILIDDMSYVDGYLYTGSESSPSYIYRVSDDLTYCSEQVSNTFCYAVSAYHGSIWGAYVGSPGKMIRFDLDLNVEETLELPSGFNNANEIAFDTSGSMYVTCWESPAKIVKFSFLYLSFPLPNRNAYTATITAVFDHSMDAIYTPNDEVVAYTGEKGESIYGSDYVVTVYGNDLYGFKNSEGTDFVINGHYSGGGDSEYLYYDGHPGYDYKTKDQKPDGRINVLAAADGVAYLGSATYGVVYIDHRNGYRTYYYHLSQRDVENNQYVDRGQVIGVSGDTGSPGSPHLHFEVRKKVGTNWIPVDPYGWEGSGDDPYFETNENLWNKEIVIMPISGKGICIVNLPEVERYEGSLANVIDRLNDAEVLWVAIKFGDGVDYRPTNPSSPLYKWLEEKGYQVGDVIDMFHDAGIKVLGWHFIYGMPIEEATVSNNILDIPEIDGFIVDVEPTESSYIGSPEDAENYLTLIRMQHPGAFVAYLTYARVWPETEPYNRVFSKYCDAVMPQAYWGMRPTEPEEEIERMENSWGNINDKWEGIPIIPMGQGLQCEIGRDVTGDEVTRFCQVLYEKGYIGVSLYRYWFVDYYNKIMKDEVWEAYRDCFNPQFVASSYSPVDIVIKDPDGFTISKESNEVLGADYMEFDMNGDGDFDDRVVILHRKLGDYLISVVRSLTQSLRTLTPLKSKGQMQPLSWLRMS